LGREDIASACRFVRDHGEIVLFGAIDRNLDEELYTTRNLQRRMPYSHGGRSFHLQGTLDASPLDLQEAIAVLNCPEFFASIAPILARPLTFEQGALHLTERALSPRSYQKYVVDVKHTEG